MNNHTIRKTTRYFKNGTECLPEEADEVIVNLFDDKGNMTDETRFNKTQKPQQEAVTPKKIHWSDIKDEMCTCGHLKSEHIGLQGHGACVISNCECHQFTWQSFILKEATK